VDNLIRLGVFDPKTAALSTLGIQMAELPLEPATSRLLLAGNELQCLTETLVIASFLAISTNSQSPLEQLGDPKTLARFAVEQGDLLTMLNIFSAYTRASYSSHWCQRNKLDTATLEKVKHVRNLLHRHLSHFKMKLNTERASPERVLKAIVKAYTVNVAKSDQLAADYTLIRNPNLRANIHPSSVLFEYLPEYVIYTDIAHTTKLFMRHITEVKPEWIAETLPEMFSMKRRQRR
jgi:HrpA-like RNA helicase